MQRRFPSRARKQATRGLFHDPRVRRRLPINFSRFRIPDVMMLLREAPREEIVRTPPLLCIEILSKADTLESIWDRIEDYFSIGVPVCWVIDPVRGRGWTAAPRILTEVADGILRAGQIEMPLDAVIEPQ
jgi:Uma2 family endonuclease